MLFFRILSVNGAEKAKQLVHNERRWRGLAKIPFYTLKKGNEEIVWVKSMISETLLRGVLRAENTPFIESDNIAALIANSTKGGVSRTKVIDVVTLFHA